MLISSRLPRVGLLPFLVLAASTSCDPPKQPAAADSATVSSSSAGASASSAVKSPADEVLVTVNGKPITRGEVEFWLMGGHGQRVTPELRKQALEELIETELMYQRGLELGLDKDKKYRAAIRKLEMRLQAAQRKEMARRIGDREISAKARVTDAEAQKYFDEHADAIKTEFHLGVLSFPKIEAAKKAQAELKGGKPFEALANAKRRPGREKGDKPAWDLGFLKWNQMPAEWGTAIAGLKPGEVSEIVQGGRTGIRIFKLIAKRPNPKAEFASMRGAIMNRLRDRRVKGFRKQYVDGLKRKATIIRSKSP